MIENNICCVCRFKHTSTPANLVMLYFEEPDTAAHAFGPESVQVLHYIQKVLIYLFIHSFICSLLMLFVNLGFFYAASVRSCDLYSTEW